MDTAIRRFRLLPSALSAAERRVRNHLLIPQLALVVAGILLTLLVAMRHSDIQTTLTIAGLDAVFLTYIAFVSPKRMHNRLVKCWDSYVLEIGPDYLLRLQADTPEIRILFREVTRVERRTGHSLRVIGANGLQVIGIPEGIERWEEVVAAVTALGPVTAPRASRALRTNVFMALGFAAYLGAMWATSPWIVVPLAVGVSALILWFVVFMQRSPNVTVRAKRTGWLYLIFVVTCGLKVLAVIGPLLRR